MSSKSRGKERASRHNSANSQEEYEPVFQPPPNCLDFSSYRSPVTSPHDTAVSIATSNLATDIAASPEELITERSASEQWNQASWTTNTKPGIFGNLAFSPELERNTAPILQGITVRSTRSSQDSNPRYGDLDQRTLTSVMESHHSSLLASLRSTLEINNSFLCTRLEEVVQELRGLRSEVERVQRGGGTGERVRELERELERERERRKLQAAEHEAEMENLYRQLSNVL